MNFAEIVIGQGNLHAQVPMPLYIYPDITKEETLKLHICEVHAHYKNSEYSGSYGEELNKILTANNPPNKVVPDCPKSDKIFTSETQEGSEDQAK